MQKAGLNIADEDLFLWHSISRGDKKAFGNFFSKYYTLLYSYCKYYVSVEDAEEIVQDVMMWLWEKRKEFTPSGSMQSYLLMAVKNRCLSFLRKDNIEFCSEGLFFTELDSFFETTDSCVVNELERLIEKTIAQLPESYRETFEMIRFQNKSRSEIALALGVSVKTVDYRMQQALSILRTQLKDYLPFLTLLIRFL